MNEDKMFHIGIRRDTRIEYAVLPGDPGRVDKIAAHLKEPVFLAENREFRSAAGRIGNTRVIITSTGIGGPSAAIALEELAACGVRTAIRVGTCGAIQQKIIPGDLIIPVAAVRMEGTSREYAPIEYPAAADLDVTIALKKACDRMDASYHTGVVQSKDSFYGQHSPGRMPVSYELENKWEAWKRLGVLASEMETAALFTVSGTLGIRCGCILHALWNQERKKAGFVDKDSFDTDIAIRAALSAICELSGENNE